MALLPRKVGREGKTFPTYEMVSRDEYFSILSDNKDIISSIDAISGNGSGRQQTEGNYFCLRKGQRNYNFSLLKMDPRLVLKQINLFSIARRCRSALEIGFNAGHTSALMLMSNNDISVEVFDICNHGYTMKCFDKVSEWASGRISISPGDSIVSVPKFFEENSKRKFDLIHVDGCHSLEHARADLENVIGGLERGGFIVCDDTQNGGVYREWKYFISDHGLKEITSFDIDSTLSHSVAVKCL